MAIIQVKTAKKLVQLRATLFDQGGCILRWATDLTYCEDGMDYIEQSSLGLELLKI